MKNTRQSGNALFYVLIGTVLFAALGYAISQSSRGSSATLSEEKAALAATEIIEFASTLTSATGQIMLRGYSDYEVDFGNTGVSGYDNANCTDEYCEVFGIEGGAAIYKEPPEEWLDTAQSASVGYGEWVVSGSNAVTEVGTDNTAELMLFLPYIKAEVCEALNDKLGVSNPFDVPPQDTGTVDGYVNKFTGSFADTDVITLPDPDKGKTSACFEGDAAPASGTYHFYQVLIVR